MIYFLFLVALVLPFAGAAYLFPPTFFFVPTFCVCDRLTVVAFLAGSFLAAAFLEAAFPSHLALAGCAFVSDLCSSLSIPSTMSMEDDLELACFLAGTFFSSLAFFVALVAAPLEAPRPLAGALPLYLDSGLAAERVGLGWVVAALLT